MKKILYSIFALSTLLFTATSCTEDRGTTTEVEESNDDENVNPKHIRGYGDREPGGMPPSSPEAGQMYGFSTEEFSQQVSSDLDLEGNVADEMVRVYYDRNRQLSELEQRFQGSATTRSGGQTADANAGTSGNQQQMTQAQMDTERKRIDDETDQRVKGILTPEQYKKYQQNRSKYNTTTTGGNTGGGNTGGNATGTGNQAGQGTTGSNQ